MDKAKVYEFPGARRAVVKSAPLAAPKKTKPMKTKPSAAGSIGSALVRVFLTIVVILHRPLGWFFSVAFTFYALRWLFQDGPAATFAGLVAVAAMVGLVAVKYILISWGAQMVKGGRR
jgi:hypothetical protein